MAATLAERYEANLHSVLSCYDRIIITGTLPGACCTGGMTSLLFAKCGGSGHLNSHRSGIS